MEQRYGTDPSRRYGTGVWNGGMERVWSRSLFRTSYFDLHPYIDIQTYSIQNIVREFGSAWLHLCSKVFWQGSPLRSILCHKEGHLGLRPRALANGVSTRLSFFCLIYRFPKRWLHTLIIEFMSAYNRQIYMCFFRKISYLQLEWCHGMCKAYSVFAGIDVESNHGIEFTKKNAQEQWLMLGTPNTRQTSAKVGSLSHGSIFHAKSYRCCSHYVIVCESW